MAKIEGIRIRNYGVLRDVTLGRLWNAKGTGALSTMTVVIGKNGVGKSTLFDAFGFLSDCLKYGVEEACDHRNGFTHILSQGSDGPIMFEVYYREEDSARPITYEVSIALDVHKRPYVKSERLRQRRKEQRRGRPFSFLILENGAGVVWILEKGDDGFSSIRRASEDPLIVGMVDEGIPLGGLWYSDYLERDERSAYV